MKYYKISEELLKSLLWESQVLDLVNGSLPTGLEGFEEEVSIEDIDLSDYPVIEDSVTPLMQEILTLSEKDSYCVKINK